MEREEACAVDGPPSKFHYIRYLVRQSVGPVAGAVVLGMEVSEDEVARFGYV